MRRGKLNPCRMEHDDELHQESRGGHLLCLLEVQECKDVALVAGSLGFGVEPFLP